ncbi:unnamed protein product, partial [Gulo gulo]
LKCVFSLGFSPVCFLRCTVKSELVLKAFPHSSHL